MTVCQREPPPQAIVPKRFWWNTRPPHLERTRRDVVMRWIGSQAHAVMRPLTYHGGLVGHS